MRHFGSIRTLPGVLAVLPLVAVGVFEVGAAAWEQRDDMSYVRGPYNTAFYWNHRETYQNAAAIHFAHGLQHDVLQLTPLSRAAQEDEATSRRYVDFLLNHRARTEPVMEFYGPYVGRMMWRLYRAIDWTHMHHEQTYDILADFSIPWDQKRAWTDRSVEAYLARNPVARSCAPLDVTMRRAATMMKPYFTVFRNQYPKCNNFFFAAHWWHPAIYEAQMMGGNGAAQQQLVRQTDRVLYEQVLVDRPLRMLLSREIMPRYARMSPESANIFDNLHMLHGIAYDILAYEGWTPEQKRAEIYRVIDAMGYQPGDDALARKFEIQREAIDPRRYEDWMRGFDGDMNRIMMEMMAEMMPLMMPDGETMSPEMHERAMDVLRAKLTPGMEEGESAGSLSDALMEVMPGMKMDQEGMKPGHAPQRMVDAMLEGWHRKYGQLPPLQPATPEPVGSRALDGGERP
jgi:hypothetical protein